MQFIFDGIRLSFGKESMNLLVIKDNDDEGVEKSLGQMGDLHYHLLSLGVKHETMERKYKGGKKIDQIRIMVVRGE